uniref:CSON009198 protein n=1 Tax=Culicoides sonorensis TaxID=179676 RepID=A0A336MBS1_CULSO
MKFVALFAIFAFLIATVYCEEIVLDPRCPVDESSESEVTYLPHETDCSKYYMCTNGRSIEMLCPKINEETRLQWDVKENVCNWPEVAQCSL